MKRLVSGILLITTFLLLLFPALSPSAQGTDDSDFIFPNSDSRKLTDEEIMQLDTKKLEYARNEIYARKGFIFKTEKFKKYFSGKSWYKPNPSFSTNAVSKIEMYNVNFIKYFEGKSRAVFPYTTNKGKYSVYKKDKKVYIDINSDGKKEEILYTIDESGYTLSINGTTARGNYGNYADSFAIVDIDKKDKYKEIVVSDYGPSDDYSSCFYFFNGKSIVKSGETGGLHEYGMDIDGAGKFSAMHRGRILQTWFFNKYYKLSASHKLVEIPQAIYTTDYDVFVKRNIKLLSENNYKSSCFTLTEGQTVKIIGTDDKQWCLVKTSTGRKGWFPVNNFNNIGTENLQATFVFAGLCYAD